VICGLRKDKENCGQNEVIAAQRSVYPEGLGKAVAVKVAEVQNMARHVLRNALVLWLSGQHLNRPFNSGEATKATCKLKWPTLGNVGILY
jgi:hypothetical protein